jgi:hypothetical protein
MQIEQWRTEIKQSQHRNDFCYQNHTIASIPVCFLKHTPLLKNLKEASQGKIRDTGRFSGSSGQHDWAMA